jgi:hypothetical protein
MDLTDEQLKNVAANLPSETCARCMKKTLAISTTAYTVGVGTKTPTSEVVGYLVGVGCQSCFHVEFYAPAITEKR